MQSVRCRHDGLSEEIAAKDREIASLREHVADREGHAAGFQRQHTGVDCLAVLARPDDRKAS
jgi:hypothetical protein